MGNVGGLIATWSYLPGDGPNYKIASGINVASLLAIFFITVGLRLWAKHDNRLREQRQPEAEQALHGMSLHDIQDLEWKHPQFRWQL